MKDTGFEGSEQQKQDAMDLAESSRETTWKHPSFMAELFTGKFRPELITPYPEQPADDKRIGDEYCRKLEQFMLKVDPEAIDRTGEIPPEIVQGLKDMGAFGMKIDRAYGGQGLSHTNYIRALTVTAGHCGNITAWLSAHQSIGVPQPLKIFGTKEQKEKFLPRLNTAVSAFALTEPGVGSDPAAMSTTATPSADGNHWIINGRKLWCTNGAVAELLVVMVRTPDKIVNGKPRKQISAFIVDSKTPGFRVVHRCRFMGLNGIQNALLEFKDVKVPKENLIGGLGDGLRIALTTLNTGRLSLPAVSVGITKKCLEVLRHWTAERIQWGTKIGNHEEIAAKNAQLAASLFAMEAITHWTGAVVDRGGVDIRLEAAISKLWCTEVCWRSIYDTLQIRGGRGFERADSLKARGEAPIPIERAFRDLRVNTILEGSTEIMHLFIAREALDTHMRLAKDLLDPRAPTGAKVKTFFRAGLFYAWWYPLQWLTIGSWFRFRGMHPRLGRHFRFIARTSHKLARNVFHMMMKHQAKLERRQMVLARLVEVGCELFAMALSVSRADAMLKKNRGDLSGVELADYFCRGARHRIRAHFRGLNCNEDLQGLKISKGIMNGDFRWLEEGTIQGNIPWDHYPADSSSKSESERSGSVQTTAPRTSV